MEHFTSCKHAPSCQISMVYEIEEGSEETRREDENGEEKFTRSLHSNCLLARQEEGNQGCKFCGECLC